MYRLDWLVRAALAALAFVLSVVLSASSATAATARNDWGAALLEGPQAALGMAPSR
jgi:hypothetical protein